MPAFIDITGQVFGRLTAKSFVGGNQYKWLCECECGNEREVNGGQLRGGATKSCGCLSRERILDISGQVFGRLTALKYVGGKAWLCECSCGNECEVQGHALRSSSTKSCGCLQRERAAEASSIHGHSKHPAYKTWYDMRTRCYNSKYEGYHRYGGRGISVCDRWRDDFPAFLADMGEKPHPSLSIERIDNDGNYEPTNCRWDTPRVQSCNRGNNNQVPGVRFTNQSNGYRAEITLDGQQVHLGSYKQHSDAAYQRLAYESLVVDQGADAAHLNLLRKLIKAVTGNKPKVREPLYV